MPDIDLEIPNATRLTPEDWREMIRDVAEFYQDEMLSDDDRASGAKLIASNDLLAFADWFPTLTARLTVLADAVREYVTDRSHMPYCGAAYGRGDPCHCGLDKLAAALGAERA